MGYWSTTFVDAAPKEVSGVWGDKPADIMDSAIDLIAAIFLAEMGRYPSQAEIVHGARMSAQWIELYAKGEEVPERVRELVSRFNSSAVNDEFSIMKVLVSN